MSKIVPEKFVVDANRKTLAHWFVIESAAKIRDSSDASDQIFNNPATKDRGYFELVLTLNGVQIPFISTLNDANKQYEAARDEDIDKAARALIAESTELIECEKLLSRIHQYMKNIGVEKFPKGIEDDY
jgi:hypothetical protein